MPSCLLKLTRVVLTHKLSSGLILTFKFMSFASIILYWRIVENTKGISQLYSLPIEISCAHYVPSPLATADGPPPSSGNVFFVETSEQTNPSYLFTCSVESAARTHPRTKVVVLMKGLAKGNTSLPNHWAFSLLSCFPNVEIRPLDLPELFSGTPLEKWYSWPLRHLEPYFLPILSDACRIVLMWKFGGIYLDTDFIVLKNLQNLTNDWKKYFEVVTSSELHRLFSNTYAVHVWNKKSQGTRLEITSQALLAQLHSHFCPATYDIMKKDSERHGHEPDPLLQWAQGLHSPSMIDMMVIDEVCEDGVVPLWYHMVQMKMITMADSEKQALMGARILTMPSCLLKLTR
ncbi:PREDICTED: lactosylceramide 4-alpha-galactosyltransferase-like, partial [Acanthisitta chloris]|uniref:lactosylceramide 4-alpha-galactosyltransferase-like n=1 Tax=Acanthisitta chloris TaxID=57068 RepID=UPI0004F0DC3F